MPVFHCTRKLAARLPALSNTPPIDDDGLGAWHANLLRLDRVQCVMFCHDETRYILLLPGMRAPQLADLGRWHRELFCATLVLEGVDDATIARAEAALGGMRFDTKTNRSVLATMNIALGDLAPRLAEAGHVLRLDPVRVSVHLNRRPTQAHGQWLWAGAAMRERLARLDAG